MALVSGTRGRILAALAVALCVTMSACGSDTPEATPQASDMSTSTERSGTATSTELSSTVQTPFDVVTVGGQRHLIGHGIELVLPDSWTTYGQEVEGTDGSTWEYAAGQPESTEPLPAGLQFSMGKPGKGAQLDGGLAEAARELAAAAPGYKEIDHGKADVANAQSAEFLRFERELDYQGSKVKVEQVSLFIQVSEGVTSTIRFIAPAGMWDSELKAVYESVKVSVKD